MPNEQIQYIEFQSKNLESIKQFYSAAFGWEFTDYGPEYTAFKGEHVDGGFYLGEPKQGSILVILFASDLESTKAKVESSGGIIVRDIFSFPGGRRFHFTDPDGNELAVWSSVTADGTAIA